MTGALLHDVDWKGATRLFVPRATIKARSLRDEHGVAPAVALAGAVRLVLMSPLALTGEDPRQRPISLIVGLAQRVEALARWHDATLGATLDFEALKARLRELTFVWTDCLELAWTRGSRRRNGG